MNNTSKTILIVIIIAVIIYFIWKSKLGKTLRDNLGIISTDTDTNVNTITNTSTATATSNSCITASGVVGEIRHCSNCGPNGICEAIVNVGQKIEVIDPQGTYMFEISTSGNNVGCLQQQNPTVLLPNGAKSVILEVRKNYGGCGATGTIPNLIRVAEGWIAYPYNKIQIIA